MVKPYWMVMALLFGCGGAPNPGGNGSAANSAGTTTKPTSAPRYELRSDESPSALSNEQQVRALLVPVRALSDGKDAMLIQIKGAGSEIDDAVIPYTLVRSDDEPVYKALIHGEPRHILYPPRPSSNRWRLYRPDNVIKVILLERDPGVNVDAAELLATYDKQVTSGMIAKIAPWSRSDREAHQDREFAADVKEATDACGGLPASIDWASVEDSWFSEIGIQSKCRRTVWPVAEFCRRYPHRVAELRQSGGLICRFKGLPNSVAPKNGGLAQTSEGLVYTPSRRSGGSSESSQPYTMLLATFDEEREVLKDGDRHIVLDRTPRKSKGVRSTSIFVGTGNNFWPQSVSVSGRRATKKDDESYWMWAGAENASIVRDVDNRWKVVCGQRERRLERVLGAERKKILSAGKFQKEMKWKRRPYFLARDAKGTYYYVDRYLSQYGGKRYRVFIGRRGQQKLSKLVNVVEDKRGTLFATKNGDLRLVVDQRGGTSGNWIRKGNKVNLTTVSVRANLKLVYEGLGAYLGVEFGHLCED